MMHEKLEKENFQTISIPESEFKWFKKNREIIVDRKMFDVKLIEKKDGVYYVTGIFDEMETALNNQLEKTSENKNSSAGTSTDFQVCLGLIAEKPATQLPAINPATPLTVKTYCFNKLALYRIYPDRFPPPPEC
jgi:hypothetical protein